MARRVLIIPHTHWDREWYAPFETFRMRLVDLLDELLPDLDGDPAYAHFMLDGQMAVVDDYLAVRPEAEPRIRRLAASGRLSVGPWYILMDEFLVSGESMVRNLQLGLERAAAFGGGMEVGYLPDMFGHVAQMPQLLRQFGFEHAVVWRGVPAAVDLTAFSWRAPDGSTVRAEYLPSGYGNGAVVPDDAKHLVARIDEWVQLHAELLDRPDTPVLWMNGTDHVMPQPWLGRVVGEANAIQDDYRLEVTSLPHYLAVAQSVPTSAARPEWDGELRAAARANLLMGVASNRVDVKQAAALAERQLERLAEPLAALFLPPQAWPEAQLRMAWTDVIRNSAHDSICACSHDEVGLAVLHRFADATRVAEGVTERALAALGRQVAGGRHGLTVVNPSARERSGLVELWVDGPTDTSRPGTQVLDARPAEVVREYESAGVAAMAVREMEWQRIIRSVVLADPEGDELVRVERTPYGELVTGGVRRELDALAASRPAGAVVARIGSRPGQRVLARVEDLPGFGWRAWEPMPLAIDPVVVGGGRRSLANGLVTVVVDPADGTFSIDGHGGLGRLVDDGDVGDTYNWCPPAEHVVVDRPSTVDIRVVEAGPLRGRLEVASTCRWPARAEGGRRVGERQVQVTTVLELRAGERLVCVEVTFDNRCRDHRVRAWFPLPEAARVSHAECAFAVVERGLVAEGGPTELPMPTYPSRRFVQAGGLTVVHEGLLEYELVDIGMDGAHALALTLLRATGLLSQEPMATRPLPAGPVVPAEAAQLQRRLTFRYGLCVGDADPYAVVDDAFLPLMSVAADAGAEAGPVEGQALAVNGAEVSALRRGPGGALEVRVFNPTAESATVAIEGRRGWLVDLRGRALEPFEGRFDVRPWRIATAVLDD
ncbi:MAG: alpha-mannosidase [Acidimicrobiales bacterium]